MINSAKISEKSLISHDWYIATDKAIKSINNVVEMENAEMKSDEKFEQEYIVTCEKSKFVKVTGRDQVKGVLEAFSSLGLNGKIKIYEIKEEIYNTANNGNNSLICFNISNSKIEEQYMIIKNYIKSLMQTELFLY